MGPRLVSRGKASRYIALNPDVFASMGPRLVSRGKEEYDVRDIILWWSFNGAATC